jgi:tetratricopeptide (TPR) repeat protein
MQTCGLSYPDLLVFFVDASSEDRIKEDYQAIVRSRGIAYRTSTYESALQWLTNTEASWLIIADNADDPNLDLYPFVPQNPRGHFIVTSRNANQALMARSCAHHIDELGVTDSIKLLLDVSGYGSIDVNITHATTIANALGHLPLAIVQAAAYIYKHKCLPNYLNLYNESREKILSQTAKELPHGYNLSVATTLEMSFNKLSIQSQGALCVLSFLQNTSIEHQIIEMAARNRFFYASGEASGADINRLKEINEESNALSNIFCSGGQWSELEFNEIIEPCFQYSLLQCTTSIDGQKFYSMHILAQNWLQIQSISTDQQSLKRLARRMLLSVVREGSLYEHIYLHQMLLPHLRPFCDQPIGVATDDALLYRVLSDSKDDSTATIHMTSYIELMKDIVAVDSLERLKAMTNLTWSLRASGRNNEAVSTGEETMELCTMSLGKDDPITLTSMSHLALAYQALGEYTKARDLNEETLRLRRQTLGPEHPDTLISMNNFALDYVNQGEYEKAQDLYQQTLALRKKVSGTEHPDTLMAMSNLAWNYSNQGEYEKARELDEQALALRKKVLGPEHPDTLFSMSNLASNYRNQREYGKARELDEPTLALRKKVLGLEHPDTLTSMNNLACNYDSQGEYEKAQELYEQTLALRKKVLGPEHPDALWSINNLALNYSDQGKYEKARELDEQTLALRKKVLGPEHPDTLVSMNNLAWNYCNQGEYEKARELHEQTLAFRKKVLGPEHPDTLLSMSNLALNYSNQGKYKKARELDEQTLTLRKKVLGPEHPDTLLSMSNLAVDYSNQGKHEKARALGEQTLALRKKVLGLEHPDTLFSMSNLAFYYGSQGKGRKARELDEQTLALRKKVLGPEHPDTLMSMNNLAWEHSNLGEYEKARQMHEETLALRRRVLGPTHPDTLLSISNLIYCLRALWLNKEAQEVNIPLIYQSKSHVYISPPFLPFLLNKVLKS